MWRIKTSYDSNHIDKHLSQHWGNHKGKRGRIKHQLCSRCHGSSLPSILLANAQVLDNKLDDLCVCIGFQRNISYCNVLCFTSLSGIPILEYQTAPFNHVTLFPFNLTGQRILVRKKEEACALW